MKKIVFLCLLFMSCNTRCDEILRQRAVIANSYLRKAEDLRVTDSLYIKCGCDTLTK